MADEYCGLRICHSYRNRFSHRLPTAQGPLTVTRDVQDWRDERETGMVYLVYLVCLIDLTGKSSGRTRQTR